MPDPSATGAAPTSPAREDRADGRLLAAVSNRIVQLHKEYYGRGPTKARTVYHGDLLVCLLEGGFSRVEQTLLERGRQHAVLEQRSEFQGAIQQEFTGAVEELTRRRVVAFMSGTHQAPDIMCEVFILGESLDSTSDDARVGEAPPA